MTQLIVACWLAIFKWLGVKTLNATRQEGGKNHENNFKAYNAHDLSMFNLASLHF